MSRSSVSTTSRRGPIQTPSSKRDRVVADSGLPWTILRVTQSYDYMLTGLRKLARLPVVPVPAGFRVQPIDTDEVAARLVELTLGEPRRPGARYGRSAGD
jgi:uncharacterized protein YbjT (DUF2867 family)